MRLALGDTVERHAFGVLVRDREGDPVVLAIVAPDAAEAPDARRGVTEVPPSAVPLVLDGLDPRLVCDLFRVGDMLAAQRVSPAQAEEIRRLLWEAVAGATSWRPARLREALDLAGAIIERSTRPELVARRGGIGPGAVVGDRWLPSSAPIGRWETDIGVLLDGGDGHPAWMVVADPGATDRDLAASLTRSYGLPTDTATPDAAGPSGAVRSGTLGAAVGGVAGVVGAACGFGPFALVAGPLLGAAAAVVARGRPKGGSGWPEPPPPPVSSPLADLRRVDTRLLPMQARLDLAHVFELLVRDAVAGAAVAEVHELLWAMADPAASESRQESCLRQALAAVESEPHADAPVGLPLCGPAETAGDVVVPAVSATVPPPTSPGGGVSAAPRARRS